MHPEIRRSGPGSCPVCGMALEPLVATASTGPSDELRDMTRRFWLGLLLAFPVLILEMGSHLFPALRNTVPPQYNMAATASGLSSRVVLRLAILRPGRNVVA